MVKISRIESVKYSSRSDGKKECVAELISDTLSEIANLSELGNVVFLFGSKALAGKEGEVAVFVSDGKWYRQSTGSEVTSDA
jgi:hypothetical protein